MTRSQVRILADAHEYMESHTPEATALTTTATTSVETPIVPGQQGVLSSEVNNTEVNTQHAPVESSAPTIEDHAATEEHTVNFYPDTLATVGKFPLTNTLVTGIFALVIFFVLGSILKKGIKLVPTKFQLIVESVWDYLNDIVGGVTGDNSLTRKFTPFIFCIFVFILINNWMGLLPGVGTIFVGHNALLRGATTDVHLTLAMALVSVILSFGIGLWVVGGWNSINRFFNLRAFLDFKKVFKKPMVIILIPIFFAVGILELVAELVKIISLTFRLYGNVYAGEVLMHTIGKMSAFVAPVPFIFLELMVGAIQAFVFTLLTLVGMYIAGTFHAHGVLGDEEEHH